MVDIKRYFEQDRLAKAMGMEIVEVSPGAAKVRMVIRDDHYNSLRMVHGGAIFSLADLAFAVASNSHGTIAVGITATISYLKAATTGTLSAEAKEESLNPKLATYSIRVTDEENAVIAVFQGTVYRKGQPLQVP